MQNKQPSGLTRASAKAVVSAGLRCVGATAKQHPGSRCDTSVETASETDVLKGCEPRRSHEPVWLTCLGIVLMLALAFAAYVVTP